MYHWRVNYSGRIIWWVLRTSKYLIWHFFLITWNWKGKISVANGQAATKYLVMFDICIPIGFIAGYKCLVLLFKLFRIVINIKHILLNITIRSCFHYILFLTTWLFAHINQYFTELSCFLEILWFTPHEACKNEGRVFETGHML